MMATRRMGLHSFNQEGFATFQALNVPFLGYIKLSIGILIAPYNKGKYLQPMDSNSKNKKCLGD